MIAIGGGSVLDTAKGARLVAAAGGSIRRFVWPGDPQPIPAPGIPLVTVPTTAGTGSEVTGGIVMIDRERELKCGAASPHNRAQDCLVDPRLTSSLPPRPTLYGGLDVLAQAIGAIVAVTHTPVADALAAEALRLVADALPAVVADGADRGARSRMACASLLAGFAMNLSEAGTDHSLGHALGVRHGVAHGLSVGVMLVEAMEHDRLRRARALRTDRRRARRGPGRPGRRLARGRRRAPRCWPASTARPWASSASPRTTSRR